MRLATADYFFATLLLSALMFGTRSLDHPDLGPMARRGRSWHGLLAVNASCTVPLVLPGPRSGPDAAAAALAIMDGRALGDLNALALNAIANEEPVATSPTDSTLLAPVTPVHATVIRLDGQPTFELGYRVPWDDEHTIGARFRDGALVDLCGSVASF